MTAEEAESICRTYGSFFANINKMKDYDKGIYVFSSSDLPWSPARLKYAFFVFAEDLVKHGEIDNHFDTLKLMYGTIDGTFKEEVDKINEDIVRLDTIKDPAEQKAEELKFEAKYGISSSRPDNNLAGSIEFHNFIADFHGNFVKQ